MKTQLPHDIEAEQHVLGGIIFDPEAIASVVNFLKPDDFYLEKHRLIYGAILDRIVQHEPVDYTTLCDDLESTGNLEQAGGTGYVTALLHRVPVDNTVEYYGRIVRKKAECRELIWISAKIAQLAYSDEEDVASKALDLIHRLR